MSYCKLTGRECEISTDPHPQNMFRGALKTIYLCINTIEFASFNRCLSFWYTCLSNRKKSSSVSRTCSCALSLQDIDYAPEVLAALTFIQVSAASHPRHHQPRLLTLPLLSTVSHRELNSFPSTQYLPMFDISQLFIALVSTRGPAFKKFIQSGRGAPKGGGGRSERHQHKFGLGGGSRGGRILKVDCVILYSRLKIPYVYLSRMTKVKNIDITKKSIVGHFFNSTSAYVVVVVTVKIYLLITEVVLVHFRHSYIGFG